MVSPRVPEYVPVFVIVAKNSQAEPGYRLEAETSRREELLIIVEHATPWPVGTGTGVEYEDQMIEKFAGQLPPLPQLPQVPPGLAHAYATLPEPTRITAATRAHDVRPNRPRWNG